MKKRKELRRAKRTLVTSLNPKSLISEQYRTIRTNIQFSILDKEVKALLCTSATSGDGKSTTVSNLAVTLAQQGQKVLLVDADLRKPTLHQIMEVSNRQGLTSLITQQATLEEVIVTKETVKGLYVLPSGPIPPNPSEMLASNAMEKLVQSFLKAYDVILFDTPPILAVADALVLATHCDGAILVTRSNQTEKRDLVRAKEHLDRANVYLFGAILNGVETKLADHRGYYEVKP